MVPLGFKMEMENLLRIAIDGVMSEFQMKVMLDESKEAAIRLLKAIQAPLSNYEKRVIDEEKEAEEVCDNLLQEAAGIASDDDDDDEEEEEGLRRSVSRLHVSSPTLPALVNDHTDTDVEEMCQ